MLENRILQVNCFNPFGKIKNASQIFSVDKQAYMIHYCL